MALRRSAEWMRAITIALGGLWLIAVFGFGVLMTQLSGIRTELLPRDVRLTAGEKPVEVVMQPCVTLKKTVGEIEVSYECCRQPNESVEDWGARCADEFEEWCKGFEG